MGASDSKLVFKQGIFRLSEQHRIAADDPYWTSFWELPESPEDVFSLFSPADIRRTRDAAPDNLETLLAVVIARLLHLRHHPAFPDADAAPDREALNCIRVLTRVLPFVYEVDALADWERRFFWTPRHNDDSADEDENRPLGEELLDTLVDLLFYGGFSVARPPAGAPPVGYGIWQSGVGCNASMPTTKEFESNRCEVLRLLLTLASPSMYRAPGTLPAEGVRALTYLCACPDKQVVLSVLCSLLNTVVKYNPASWRVPYNSLVFQDPKQILVTYSLHVLLVLLLYPVPPDPVTGTPAKNYYRHFLGRIHRPADFQFIVDGMTRILNQPLQATAAYLPGTQTAVKVAPEILMLFWELTQCNKRFRAFIIDTQRAHDFVVLIAFYALECKADGARQGIVRMCAFLLQTLSVEANFGIRLNEPFVAQDTLPPVVRIPNFRGSYADFLLQSIYLLITTSQSRLAAIYPALLAVINNMAAHVEGLSARTADRLLQLFASMSAPSFLLANEGNHRLLRSLLEAFNAVLEHQYAQNPQLVFAILRSQRRFEALRTLTLDGGREAMQRRAQRRKDGAGGDDDTASRRSSADSLRSPSLASIASPRTSSRAFPTLRNVAEDDTFSIGDEDEGDDDDDDDAVPTQLRGMSEKARGKMPAGAGPLTFSRQNSTTSLGSASLAPSSSTDHLASTSRGDGPTPTQTPGSTFEATSQWFDSWLPDLPLHTILTAIRQLTALLPPDQLAVDHPAAATLDAIRTTRLVGVEPSAVRVHSFEWSPLALGWYESLIWSFVFSSEMQVAKGSVVGVWNGTAIKLFRVQEAAHPGPSLTSPRGAVDAVGSNIVSRIGQMNLRAPANAANAAPHS